MADLLSISGFRLGSFGRSSPTSHFNTALPVATLSGALHYGFNAGTG